MNPQAKLILGIESSCDECSASVVEYLPQTKSPLGSSLISVLSTATFSQTELHAPYGGVVPEIASRNHLETINAMIDLALKRAEIQLKLQGRVFARQNIAAIAVTNRPGLVGALLVGVSAAKSLAYAWKIPLVPVHHLEGHAASLFLRDATREATESAQPISEGKSPVYPLLLAIISGGHTNLHVVPAPPELWPPDFLTRTRIGRSKDDAAGEAFDKVGKLLGFAYPAGKSIDQTARGGDGSRFSLPKALPRRGDFDFSFSGLKTAAAQLIQRLKKEGTLEQELSHLCASVQSAIIGQILGKMEDAVQIHRCRAIAVVGGVAANSELRFGIELLAKKNQLSVFMPELQYCTDNAAMIAAAGTFRWRQGHQLSLPDTLMLNALPGAEV